jgi:hypothetical protein
LLAALRCVSALTAISACAASDGSAPATAVDVDGIVKVDPALCKAPTAADAPLRESGILDVSIDNAYTALLRLAAAPDPAPAFIHVTSAAEGKQQTLSYAWADIDLMPNPTGSQVLMKLLLVHPASVDSVKSRIAGDPTARINVQSEIVFVTEGDDVVGSSVTRSSYATGA